MRKHLPQSRARGGFTLVELLVVVSIMLLLTTMVVVLYNSSFNSERVRGSARQIQSVILGAQSRTVQRKVPTGIRLILDATDPTVSTGFVYVGDSGTKTLSLSVCRSDPDLDGKTDTSFSWWLSEVFPPNAGAPWPSWPNPSVLNKLYQQNLIVNGNRVRIRNNWYSIQIDTNLISKGIVGLTAYRPSPTVTTTDVMMMDPDLRYPLAFESAESCEFELQHTLVPDEKPLTFAAGMGIDLYNSRIPSSWYSEQSIANATAVPNGWYYEGADPSNSAMKIIRAYSPRMDIMFSPRGECYGALSSQGIVHLLLADIRDTTLNNPPEAGQYDCIAVSLFTRTGAVVVSPVDKENGISQRFRFAEIGSAAAK